ncbi:MAG: hypothetical protein BGO01_02380 [Armatimonadetes bacterium 55-13]|nr:DUF4157 domain-containing protein [Armatimonadota bacterium]OJU65775.1 MAG: hypothetical protein BGO01_02380 [Armatimonadetes bacterium 55-13]
MRGIGEEINSAGRAAEGMARKVADATGLTGATQRVEETVGRVQEFAISHIDSLLMGVESAVGGTLEFAGDLLQGTTQRVHDLVERELDLATEVAREVGTIPGRAMRLLDEADVIRQRAIERRRALRAHAERFRRRRNELPRVVRRHIEEISIELEEEMMLDADEAQRVGEQAAQDTQRLYDQTVTEAQNFGLNLAEQTRVNHDRARRLASSTRDGIHSASQWAQEQRQRIHDFRTSRVEEARRVRSLQAAQEWATRSTGEAHALAGEIQADVASRPSRIASFAQGRVQEAMDLAQGVRREIQTARSWIETQTGNNAAWMRAMKQNSSQFQSFLQGQAARTAMRVVQHGRAIEDTAANLARDQVADTAGEVGQTKGEIQKSIREVKREVEGDVRPLAEDMERNATAEVQVRSRDRDARLKIDLPSDDAPAEVPEDDEASAREESPVQSEAQKPREREKPQESETAKSVKASPEKSQGLKKPKMTPKSADPKHEVKVGPEVAMAPGASATAPEGVKTKSVSSTSTETATTSTTDTSAPPKSTPTSEASSPSTSTSTSTSTTSSSSPNKGKTAPIKPHSKVAEGQKVSSMKVENKEKPKLPEGAKGAKPGEAHVPTPKTSTSTSTTTATSTSSGPKSPMKKPTPNPKATTTPGKALSMSDPKQVPPIADKAKESKPAGVKQAMGLVPQRSKAARDEVTDPKTFQERLLQAGGKGDTPDAATRSELAKHVGFDPKMVRFHTGPAAQAAAKSLSADAFTIGPDIFFAEGKFDPRSPQGLGLIGHEVTHVGQQFGLLGSPMRFATQSGGDAMEQEAQEVGERIATNLSYSAMLRVGRYVRTYEPADDEPITTGVQTRLDRLSLIALRNAGRLLTQSARPQPVRLDQVSVDLELDLDSMSDQEIVDAWAEAIASAVEATRATEVQSFDPYAAPEAATHLLQMRLGDPSTDPVVKAPEISPEAAAAIAKITATAQEREMMRQLTVKPEVDPYIVAVKLRKAGWGQYAPSPQGGFPAPRMPNQTVDSDEKWVIEKLQTVDINSIEEFEKLQTDFVSKFQAKGVNVTHYLLDQNLEVVLREKSRYLANQANDKKAPINTIKESGKKVLAALEPFIAALNDFLANLPPYAPSLPAVSTSNYDHSAEMISSAVNEGRIYPDEKIWNNIISTQKTFDKVRKAEGNTHVIFLGYNFDPTMITNASNDGELEMSLFKKFLDVEEDIRYAKGELNDEKFWELHAMVNMTKQQMGVRRGEGSDQVIQKVQQDKANDAALWGVIQAAASIALAITAMVATGGLAAVAMVGAAGLSVYGAAKSADEYMFKSAAVNSSLDQARLLSKDDPSMLWLALELVGAGMDVGAAVGAFGKLAKIAKTAAESRAAFKELEETARQAYRETKGLTMTEDAFVNRLLESAKKGVKGAEEAVSQAKVIRELLEGTSPRVVGILKGEEGAIKSILAEHGNWKGLMGALTNGGEDGQKMASAIGKYRNEVIADLKARGASPLEDASTDLVSDFDLNVKGENAGQAVLDFEKEMAGRFGPNWSEALNINFYTDKSQLLSVEQALKLVSPQKKAQILKRVTERAEELNFAKMLEHAGEDPDAIRQVEELMAAAGVKYDTAHLKEIAKTVHAEGRDALLKSIDKELAELNAMKPGDPARVAKAERVTMLQMEANFLTKEAYIGPAAVKGAPLTNAEAYQSALSQLEMMKHVVHDAGGDILAVCREYEFFKYVNRYAAAAQKAGVKSPGLTYFEGLSAYIYKRARSAHMSTGHLPGVTPADEALESAVDAEFLLAQYNSFRQEVESTLPKIKAAAEANPAGGWKPDIPMRPPAAGAPAAPPKPKGPGATPKPNPAAGGAPVVPGAPGGGSSAALPAAAIKAAKEADKMEKEKGKGLTKFVAPMDAVQSAGFSTMKSMQQIGMFRGRIAGVSHDVMITIFPIDEKSKFESQLAAAIAAEKTGLGPKVYGKVEMGDKKIAFAMDEVKGDFADDYYRDTDPEQRDLNKRLMMSAAKDITETTFVDLDNYRNSIWENGFYYTNTVEGFVAADGHWKPVNFYNTAAITETTDQAEARKLHDQCFDGTRDRLMQNHMIAKKEAAKP